MERHDPEVAPIANDWLALDEGTRIMLVEHHHRDARISIPKARRRAHASIHVVVENQLAMDDEPVVRAVLRLTKEGLSRHDAIHAIGSVVAELIFDAVNHEDAPETSRAHYYAAVERLNAKAWRDGIDGSMELTANRAMNPTSPTTVLRLPLSGGLSRSLGVRIRAGMI